MTTLTREELARRALRLKQALARAKEDNAGQAHALAVYTELAPDIEAAVEVIEELDEGVLPIRTMKDLRATKSVIKLAAVLIEDAQKLINVQSAVPVFPPDGGLKLCVICMWGHGWGYNREDKEKEWRATAAKYGIDRFSVLWTDDEVAAAIKLYW